MPSSTQRLQDQVGLKRSKKEALFSPNLSPNVTTVEKRGSCPHLQSHPISAASHVFPYWDPCRNLCESRIRLNVSDAAAATDWWRLNMAVFPTSKAGIDCLHHQSHGPIYTADKYGKHRPFVLPQTAKIQKPSNILKWTSRSLHLASFPTPLRRSKSAPVCSHFLPLITCTS